MIQIPTAKLQKLRRELQGHVNKVATECGKSFSAVSMVLNGHYYNERIINACINYRNRMQKESKQKAKRLAEKI